MREERQHATTSYCYYVINSHPDMLCHTLYNQQSMFNKVCLLNMSV